MYEGITLLSRLKTLPLAIALGAALVCGTAVAQTKDYIVVLSEAQMAPVQSKETIRDDRYALLGDAWGYLPQKVVKEVLRLEKRHDMLVKQTYSHVMTGFSASLTPEQAAAMRREPTVAWMEEDRPIKVQLLDLQFLNSLLGNRRAADAPVAAPAPAPSPSTPGSDQTTITLPTFPGAPQTPAPSAGANERQTISYGITNTGANNSWAQAGNGSGSVDGPTVYIIDTGISDHRDLNVVRRVNFAGGVMTDCNGHGTHVAGIAGARDNAVDTVGVAPGVRLVGVKALGCNGGGTVANAIKAVDWVTANAIKPAVANLSFSLVGSSRALELAVLRSAATGILYTIAAGNDGIDACLTSPANLGGGANPAVFTASAVNRNNQEASFSNFGRCVDLWAPGVDIPSSRNGGGVTQLSGTSMATPHISGAAALYWGIKPQAPVSEVAAYLRTNRVLGTNRSRDGDLLRLLRADVAPPQAAAPAPPAEEAATQAPVN